MADIRITEKNFESEVMQSDIPVLLDFWASWCGPCKMFTPVVEEFAKENEGTIKVGKINVDEEPDLAGRFGVMSIPHVVVVKNGEVVNSSTGFCPKEKLAELVK